MSDRLTETRFGYSYKRLRLQISNLSQFIFSLIVAWISESDKQQIWNNRLVTVTNGSVNRMKKMKRLLTVRLTELKNWTVTNGSVNRIKKLNGY